MAKMIEFDGKTLSTELHEIGYSICQLAKDIGVAESNLRRYISIGEMPETIYFKVNKAIMKHVKGEPTKMTRKTYYEIDSDALVKKLKENGYTISSMAKAVGVSESGLRYSIKRGSISTETWDMIQGTLEKQKAYKKSEESKKVKVEVDYDTEMRGYSDGMLENFMTEVHHLRDYLNSKDDAYFKAHHEDVCVELLSASASASNISLFNSYALCKVPWLVRVVTAQNRTVIGKKLSRNNRKH
jgi:transposase-like protein